MPNPVNFSFYNEYPSPEEPDDEYVNIVFVGRLVERKGAQHLIALMQEGLLNCNEKKVRLTIAGAGPMEDELRKQAAHITYPGYEVMFLGSISDEDKASLFKSSDLAVFPATGGESFGIILLEAMSAGRPIVFGGNNPGYEHVLTSDHPRPDAPVSFDPANLGHMSTIINAYIDNETLRSQVRLAQTDKARKHDISVIGRQLMKRYLA
ncbi:MAG: glycosyltransferase family 4 protein [Candidatus Saccharimonadales bacterium]